MLETNWHRLSKLLMTRYKVHSSVTPNLGLVEGHSTVIISSQSNLKESSGSLMWKKGAKETGLLRWAGLIVFTKRKLLCLDRGKKVTLTCRSPSLFLILYDCCSLMLISAVCTRVSKFTVSQHLKFGSCHCRCFILPCRYYGKKKKHES